MRNAPRSVRPRSSASRLAWLVLLGAALPSAGCSSLEDDLCTAKCDCEGCSNADFDDCVSDYDVAATRADRNGCLDLYDDLLACRDDTGVCRGADWDTDCKVEKERFESCNGSGTGNGDIGCFATSDCPGGGKPFCGPGGTCVECLEDSQCDKGKKCTGNKCD